MTLVFVLFVALFVVLFLFLLPILFSLRAVGNLFVYPQHRGRGLGRQLLRHLARVAVERDYGRVEWSVLDWNVDAIGFYRSIGAELLDDWRRCRLTGDAIPALAGR